MNWFEKEGLAVLSLTLVVKNKRTNLEYPIYSFVLVASPKQYGIHVWKIGQEESTTQMWRDKGENRWQNKDKALLSVRKFIKIMQDTDFKDKSIWKLKLLQHQGDL